MNEDDDDDDVELGFRRASFLDASAFLELERGLSDRDKKDLDGVEAAILAAQQQQPQGTLLGRSSSKAAQLRVSKASLDKISAAAKAGSLSTFGSFREGTVASMDSIRELQERIFEEHMRFDVFENQHEIDLAAKDFLPRYTAAHELKESTMQGITVSLGQLATQITEVGAQLVGVIDPLSATLAADTQGSTPPKITLKSVATKMVNNKRVERTKRDTMLRDLVKDAKTLEQVNRNVPSSDAHT